MGGSGVREGLSGYQGARHGDIGKSVQGRGALRRRAWLEHSGQGRVGRNKVRAVAGARCRRAL